MLYVVSVRCLLFDNLNCIMLNLIFLLGRRTSNEYKSRPFYQRQISRSRFISFLIKIRVYIITHSVSGLINSFYCLFPFSARSPPKLLREGFIYLRLKNYARLLSLHCLFLVRFNCARTKYLIIRNEWDGICSQSGDKVGHKIFF